MKLKYLILAILIIVLPSCSGGKNKTETPVANKEKKKDNKEQYLFDKNSTPFYTVDPKLDDIEAEIAILKEKVIQYESQISVPNFNTEILKLIKNPNIKHQIQLSNGTTIQGTIIYENADEMIVETQIGQLRINKNQVIKTEDVLPPIANLEFVGDAIEEIYSDKRAYQGNIKNTGLKRADFVRVIYSMYDQNSNLIASDSAFISGSKKIFNSGIISDASINPGDYSDFYVTINIPSDKIVKYSLRDIRWEYFE